jgi:Sulfotransferase family
VSLTFVVNTGRSGSTMLSRILHMHPAVLSLSEFFNSITGLSSNGDQNRWEFPTEDMDGQEFWQLISAPAPLKDSIVLAGLKSSEMCYPYDTGRFDAATGVPTICNATLPLLSDDPDALFDQLAARIPNWPKRSAAEQFRALFSTLAAMLGRPTIVERSGSSLPLVPVLRRLFPEARFVLQYRDGLDCALSMRRHVSGQFAGIIEEAIRITGLPPTATWKELLAAAPEEFNGLLTEPFDVARIMAYPVPMTFFGQAWAWMMWVGTEAIKRLPRDIWTTLQYERLIASPAEELTRLAEFINVPATPEWLDKACSSMDSGRVGSARSQLDPDTLAALQEACEPGTRAIRQLESEYGLQPKLSKLPATPPGARRRSPAGAVASRGSHGHHPRRVRLRKCGK